MSDGERLIMVIDDCDARADGLKSLIEFMDSPEVCTATPDNWQARMGSQRLAALFVSETLPETDIQGLLEHIAKVDPNVPIVMINGEQHV